MTAGSLRDRVAFDAPTKVPDGNGGKEPGWAETYVCWAEFRYQRGQEAETAGALTGIATFKVKVRSCTASRAVTAEYRMRDVRRGIAFNIREVDAVTDRAWVWIVAEGGVAV